MGSPAQAKPLKRERLDLIPPGPLLELSRAFARGAEKYSDHAYLVEDAEYRRYQAALMRHVLAWAGGEDVDAESGVHHLALASANCCILQALQDHGLGVDDRLKTPAP